MKGKWIRVIGISLLICGVVFSGAGIAEEEASGIRKLSGYEELKELLEEKEMDFDYRHVVEWGMEESMESALPADSSAKQSIDYSSTNIQVEGVDEGDIVKTDGSYLYRVTAGKILILKVDPASSMEKIGSIDLNDGFRPTEIYLDDDYLVVLGSGPSLRPIKDPVLYDSAESSELTVSDVAEGIDGRRIYPSFYWNMPSTSRLQVYDIKNPEEAAMIREVILEGQLFTSRKIGKDIYFVTNRNLDYYGMNRVEAEKAKSYMKPKYKDSAIRDGEVQQVEFEEIGYFPDSITANYITVAGVQLDHIDKPVITEVLMGRGDHLYASRKNLYMAMEKRKAGETETDIFRFALKEGAIKHQATGTVPGRVLNQFSMDEYDETFRVATTTGQMWRMDEHTSKNHVFILDLDLKIVGSIEDIAPTERIYSARFMGDRAYLVTFREIDPFYVIDIKDPLHPKILGYLKIPGYSDYLHPYDENHILGFGKEVYDIKGNAIPGGFKIGLFDVTDVEAPIEKFKLEIGDTGTDSELLRNHRALLFSKERDLIAFPITIMTKSNEEQEKNPWQRGMFTFQGAHVYGLDLEEGFQLKKEITHLNVMDYIKAGSHWYGSDKNVDRILYIDDLLLTISDYKMQRHDLETLQLKDELIFER
ncbi:Secreted protein containing C-terminal beta-propeller domain [Tindallia magadiensis]|uniref:Secreted protein containing C-terminal beta-propeller domain n=1 Tax=Tindallia magadiensis TaxID=69895 RepID=A0A1I3BCE6_9FIRM|nr:beta-propeller domain-containing protein [Tindallia magadiensis]SFH59820.1 Secreted protein containing C-terminal beta-propeller domain [Tindallia magadiensis]